MHTRLVAAQALHVECQHMGDTGGVELCAGVLQLMAWTVLHRAPTLSLNTGGMLSTSMTKGDF